MKSITRICCPSFVALQLLAIPASAQPQSVTIEKIFTNGWEVAGYIAASGNRSLILFKHRDHKYLVQCSALVDVTRAQSLVITCYDLKCNAGESVPGTFAPYEAAASYVRERCYIDRRQAAE
jgi:hypothetical protein